MSKNVFWVTVVFFAVFFFIDELYFQDIRREINNVINQLGISHIITYSLVGIPLFAGVLFLYEKEGFLESLGLNRPVSIALIFSLVCTVPMFFIYPFIYDFKSAISLNNILIIGIAAGFFEELYYRGFLFGLLYRFTRFGFITAAFLSALVVAVLQIISGSELAEIVLIFLITFFSGLVYGWVYAEWNYNLWVPVFLHMFINLSWEMFAIEEHEMGMSYANIIRFITVILFIVLTIIYKWRKGLPMEIKRGKWFMKKKELIPANAME